MMLLNIPTNSESRQRLYYNRFQYRLVFTLPGAPATDYRRDLDQYKQHLAILIAQTDKDTRLGERIASIDIDMIEKFLDLRRKYFTSATQLKNDVAIFTEWSDTVRIYCNDLNVISEVVDLNFGKYQLTKVDLMEAQPDVKLFRRKPKHQYRIYLKEKEVDVQWKTDFLKFLDNQSGLYPCPALKEFLGGRAYLGYWGRYTSASHFIEYDDDGLRMLLLLFVDQKYIGRRFILQQID